MAGTPNLSPVFLDNSRVTLGGDPRPHVSKILQASGKEPETQVLWVRAPDEDLGRQVAPDEVIDRTILASQPVHLRSAALVQQSGSAGPGSGPGILQGHPRHGPTEANSSGRSMEPSPSSPSRPGLQEGGGWNLEGSDGRTPFASGASSRRGPNPSRSR
jgi:hypothetical protein